MLLSNTQGLCRVARINWPWKWPHSRSWWVFIRNSQISVSLLCKKDTLKFDFVTYCRPQTVSHELIYQSLQDFSSTCTAQLLSFWYFQYSIEYQKDAIVYCETMSLTNQFFSSEIYCSLLGYTIVFRSNQTDYLNLLLG